MALDRLSVGYQKWVGKLLIHKIIAGAIYAVVIAGLLFMFQEPAKFIPAK